MIDEERVAQVDVAPPAATARFDPDPAAATIGPAGPPAGPVADLGQIAPGGPPARPDVAGSRPAVVDLVGLARDGAAEPGSRPAVADLVGLARDGAAEPGSRPAVADLEGVARDDAAARVAGPRVVDLDGSAARSSTASADPRRRRPHADHGSDDRPDVDVVANRSGRSPASRRSSGAAGRTRVAGSETSEAGTRGEPADRRRRPGPRPIDPDADPVAAAREICLSLLTDRARTKHELADALRRREVPNEAAAAVLDRFDEVGLIDDAAFAGQWVRSRQRTRGLARRALAVELRRKGVNDEVAVEALAEVDPAAEEERARELVARKLRTVPAGTPEQRATAARRLVGMLARKGYPGGIAYRVVREALAAHGAEDDELGTGPVDD